MKTKFLIVAALLLSVYACGQGRKVNGLKVGSWKDVYWGEYHLCNYVGNFKVVPVAKYKRLEEGNGYLKVRFKSSTPMLYYDARVQDSISVKDSVWNTYYAKSGGISEVSSWNEGLLEWSKSYDEKGNLRKYVYNDYDKDSTFEQIFIEGHFFKKAAYSMENIYEQAKVFYPDGPLTLSNAELYVHVDFISEPSVTEVITIGTKKDVTISSIVSMRNFVKITVNDKPVSFPLTIRANTTVPLKITMSPTSTNYALTDTIDIKTTDSEYPYRICAYIIPCHLNGRTASVVKSVRLSKSKDKYLVLPAMGTGTAATITSASGKVSEFIISKLTRITNIDLSAFDAGTYRLNIVSCHIRGEMELVLTE